MALSDFFRNFPALARQAAEVDGKTPEHNQPPLPISRKTLAGFNDDALVNTVLQYMHKNDDMVVAAMTLIKSQSKLRCLALDPDMSDLVRLYAISHLEGESGAQLCEMIAQSEFNRAIALHAANHARPNDSLAAISLVRFRIAV